MKVLVAAMVWSTCSPTHAWYSATASATSGLSVDDPATSPAMPLPEAPQDPLPLPDPDGQLALAGPEADAEPEPEPDPLDAEALPEPSHSPTLRTSAPSSPHAAPMVASDNDSAVAVMIR